MDQQLRRKIDALWRIESAKIVAAVARLVRDVGLAEDLAGCPRRRARALAAGGPAGQPGGVAHDHGKEQGA